MGVSVGLEEHSFSVPGKLPCILDSVYGLKNGYGNFVPCVTGGARTLLVGSAERKGDNWTNSLPEERRVRVQ